MRLELVTPGPDFWIRQIRATESAGQEQALRDVAFVPYAKQLYQEILSMIFPGKPSRQGR